MGQGKRARTRIVVWVATIVVAAGLAGCTTGGEPDPWASDSVLQSLAGDALAGFLREERISFEETVFSIDVFASGGRLTVYGKTSDEELKVALLDRLARAVADYGADVVDRVALLPAASLGDLIYAVVKVPVTNLGDAPGSATGSHTVTQARMGDVLRLLEEKDGWYLARMHDDYLGWVDSGAVHACEKGALDDFRGGPAALITAKNAPPLLSPGGGRRFPLDLVQGTVLPIAGSRDEWTRLRMPDGGDLWVETAKTERFDDASMVFAERKGAQAVLDTALQYLGLPYLWGGTTSYGFDCSGFVQFAFRMNGYRLRRDAGMQYEQGDPVADRKDLKPGDLVFFQTYARGASHVGIYMGDSKYVQSGSGGVSVLSFAPSDPEYSAALDRAYLGARRITK